MNANHIERVRRYSHIGTSSNDNYVYGMQYKRAFEVLYSSKQSVDTIVLPMLYTLRHYIELMLKYNVEYFHEFSNSKNMVEKQEHKLMPLADAFKEHWTIVVKKYNIDIDDKDYFKNLYILINLINELDLNSMSFRYSHNKEKEKHFEWLKQIDILEIKELFDKVTPLLNYSIDVFDDKTGLMHGVDKSVLLS